MNAPEYPDYTVKWSRDVALLDPDGNPIDAFRQEGVAVCYARTTINGQTAACTVTVDRERLDRIGDDEEAKLAEPAIRAAFEDLL
jgi:hypothetical protein